MNRPVVAALLATVLSCASPAQQPIDQISFSTCDGKNYTVTVTTDRIPIGPSSNAIRKFGDDAFVVESGSNTIKKFDLQQRTEFDLGNDRNPWDVWASNDEVWVTNFLKNTVSVFDRGTGQLIEEILDDAFDNPSAIVGFGDSVFVSQVAFRGTEYGAGSIVQIDRATREVRRSFPTLDRNPQFLSLIKDGDVDLLAIVNSGEFDVSSDGAFVKTDGSLELWTLEPGDETSVGTQENFPLPLVENRRIGSPSEVMQFEDALYLGSGSAPILFKFDLGGREFVNGTRDPITLYDTDDDALHRTTLFRDLIWISAFNRDELLVFDPHCDKVVVENITVDRSDLLAGPFGTVFFRDEVDVGFFILSNANALGRMELTSDDDG